MQINRSVLAIIFLLTDMQKLAPLNPYRRQTHASFVGIFRINEKGGQFS